MSKVSQALDRSAVAISGARIGAAATGDREPGFLKRPHDPAIIKLFYTVEALRPENANVIIQFIAATAGEGTSTIARGFAAVAASEGNQRVLLIDCSRSPELTATTATTSLVAAFKQGISPDQLFSRNEQRGGLETVRLADGPNPLIAIDSEDLIRLMNGLREMFSMILLDCAAATEVPDSVALSRYCDGTILVVRAEYSRSAVIRAVQNDIRIVGGQILGVAFNRRRTYIPSWLYTRLFSGSSRDSA
jgi:Mrp family chromosome partitioning ATPase